MAARNSNPFVPYVQERDNFGFLLPTQQTSEAEGAKKDDKGEAIAVGGAELVEADAAAGGVAAGEAAAIEKQGEEKTEEMNLQEKL